MFVYWIHLPEQSDVASKRIKINGIIYSSRQEASRQTKIPTGSFSYLIKNKPSSTKWDWLWQIEDVV